MQNDTFNGYTFVSLQIKYYPFLLRNDERLNLFYFLVDSENLSALPRDTVSPHHEVALQLGYDSHEKKQHLQVLAMMPRKAHQKLEIILPPALVAAQN